MDLVWLSLGGDDLTQYLLVIIQNELVVLMIGLRDHAKLLSDVVMSFCWRSEPRITLMGLTKVLDMFPAPNIRPRRQPGPEPVTTPDKKGAFFARSGRRSGASFARTSGDRHRDAGIHYHTATRCDTNWRSSGSALLVIAIPGQVSRWRKIPLLLTARR
ncbi:hypothetical protein BO79DRAFT_240654 [Aspergillus costaricaensis CBS 115574]|uniref:Uncharacterized protein n=1 Tax=Aspergillus costaricaensis CBS 115574 TaxID=1448317 RepID=A0ACD1I1A0_9EURO|nr:hypothetical protein BO79DRAFT_240654 [Aspergillus costaricaensis CBS 115574]RAK84233.1 hypothetical protein BO79DRAFT_240654 [Aspergillus costaricaensis CBS 115574]